MKRTSRVLNDDSQLLGLSFMDITGVGIFLLILMIFGKILHTESMLWALSLAVAALFCLIPIRFKLRRKIIRDFMSYCLKKGVQNVSKNHRE